MTAESLRLRASDFANPEMAARRLTKVLSLLREELTVRRQLVELDFTTDAAGNVSTISVKAPAWPVKGVACVFLWDKTSNLPSYARVNGHYEGNQFLVTIFAGDVSPSRTYLMRLELTGE